MNMLKRAALAAACALLCAAPAYSGPVTAPMQADASAAISMSSATTTELVAAVSGQQIYVTHYNVIAAGTGNFKLVYGTGSNCGTGTTDATGNYNLTAQAGVAAGNGLGVLIVIPPGRALCATNSAAVGMYGLVSYSQR
ncbi:hypothetical protein [Synechococcus phage Ssp-JY42]|nr:hypothetical protein [Synechococcus phage Yong-M4-211]